MLATRESAIQATSSTHTIAVTIIVVLLVFLLLPPAGALKVSTALSFLDLFPFPISFYEPFHRVSRLAAPFFISDRVSDSENPIRDIS